MGGGSQAEQVPYDLADPVIQVEREALKLAVQRPALCGPAFDVLGPAAFTAPPHAAVRELIDGCGGARGAAGAQEWVARLRDARWQRPANVREADAPLIHVGDPVEVRVLAYPDRIFKAKISWIAASIDPSTRRLSVRADVENPQGELKPGMFANFSIIIGNAEAAPAVPQSAIVYEGDTARIWVAAADGTVAARPIRIGRSADGMVEVLEGLSQGEKVVTSGALFIDRAASSD